MFGKLVASLPMLALSATLRAQVAVHFAAHVQADEPYVHSIGHGLFFVVEQDDAGTWDFRIRPSIESQEDYTDCLKSPFLHGPDVDDLLAWRFAAGGDESTPEKKDFVFLTNAADQTYECAERDAMYDSFERSQRGGRDPKYTGLPHYRPRPTGHVHVLVSAVSLKAGLSKEDAEFREVSLEVTITFPKARRRR